METTKFLTENEIRQIHQATLRVLEEAGIKLTLPAARHLLAEAGARLGPERASLPAELVESCLALCPPVVRLAGRDPQKAIRLGGTVEAPGDQTAHNTGGGPWVYEPGEGRLRPAGRADTARLTRLLDALPRVNQITPICTPQDVAPEQMSLWMYLDTIANTTKPVLAPGIQTAAEVCALSEMARIAYGGTGEQSLAVSPVSPLLFPDDVAGAILEIARQGWVFNPLPCPTVGATAPMSLAGALVQQNAEVLAAIVLAELARPGLPAIYHGRLGVMEPRSGISVWGNPEIGILSAATVQLAHFYGLAVNVKGFVSNSPDIDIQSGYERAINALVPAQAGADELSGLGDLGAGMMSSAAQIVIDHEILESVRRVQRGVTVDEDSLAVEVIKAATAGRGDFLAERHTVQYLRKGEVLRVSLARRLKWEQWDAAGRPDLPAQAEAEANRILAGHSVPPLSPEQERECLAVIAAAAGEQ